MKSPLGYCDIWHFVRDHCGTLLGFCKGDTQFQSVLYGPGSVLRDEIEGEEIREAAPPPAYTTSGYRPHRCVASIIILKFSGFTELWMLLDELTM